jgi:L-asparaginase
MEPIQLTDAPIHFILTGGTVDSRYAPDKCAVVPRQHSGIPEYLTEVVGLGKEEIRFTEVCMKDSRGLTDKEVDKIKTTIENISLDLTFRT